MTKAFKLDNEHWDSVDLDLPLSLPEVHCDVCGQTWGDAMFDYATLDFDFFNPKEFYSRRVITVREFQKLSTKICQAAGRKILLRPGASIGTLAGKAFKTKLDDFIWGRICFPQISRTAKAVLEEEGISFPTAEIKMKFRGRPIDTHLAIEPELAAMMTEESIQEHRYRNCQHCGDFSSLDLRPPKIKRGYRLDQSKWPKDAHLVTMAEIPEILASDEFIKAVRRRKLTGLKFEECGRFV